MQRITSVSRGGLYYSVSRFEDPSSLSVLHHPQTNPVLHAAASIEVFTLCHYKHIRETFVLWIYSSTSSIILVTMKQTHLVHRSSVYEVSMSHNQQLQPSVWSVNVSRRECSVTYVFHIWVHTLWGSCWCAPTGCHRSGARCSEGWSEQWLWEEKVRDACFSNNN